MITVLTKYLVRLQCSAC